MKRTNFPIISPSSNINSMQKKEKHNQTIKNQFKKNLRDSNSYFPHCWQYLLLSPSRKTELAFAHRKQTRCLLWYPLSSLISASHPETWHRAGPPGARATRFRFFPGRRRSSSSSFASNSGQAHGTRPAKKFEHTNLGSRFLT